MEIILIFVTILLSGFFVSDINNLSEIMRNILGFGMIVAIGGLILFRRKRLKSRCHKCKRNWALKFIEQRTIKTEKISVLVELDSRDLARNVTGTHEQYIPGKRNIYQYTYQCKHCGNLENRVLKEDKASI